MDAGKLKRRPKSVSSDNRLRPKMIASPYSQNYQTPIPHCRKHLISMHLAVTKLSRPELEDRYLQLCDENYQIKHENKDLKERLKVLTTRIMRVSSTGIMKKFKSVDGLSHSSKENEGEYCQIGRTTRQRPASQRKLKSRNESRDQDQAADSGLNRKTVEVSRIEELQAEIEKKKIEVEELKTKNAEWETKFREIDEKLFDETKKLVAANMAVKSLKRKTCKYEVQVKQLKTDKRELERKVDNTIETERKKYDELRATLEQERSRAEELAEQKQTLEVNHRQVLDLKEQIIQLETEKSSLKVQQENFTKLIEETASTKAHLEDLQERHERTCKHFEEEQMQTQALASSQEHLLSKLKTLQDENDKLSVELQGLKGRIEYYTNENVSLELRLRDAEAQKDDLEIAVRRSSIPSTKIESMKEVLINKLSAVTFEPWDVDGVRTSSAASSRRSSVTSQKSLSKILGTPSNQSPQKMKLTNSNNSISTPKSSEAVNESELINRNLPPETPHKVHGKLTRFKTYSISFEDSNSLTIDEDLTPTRDQSLDLTKGTETCAHDISLQAEKAANALIKNIKRSSIPSEDVESSLGSFQ